MIKKTTNKKIDEDNFPSHHDNFKEFQMISFFPNRQHIPGTRLQDSLKKNKTIKPFSFLRRHLDSLVAYRPDSMKKTNSIKNNDNFNNNK
jgi:hypothetical protein